MIPFQTVEDATKYLKDNNIPSAGVLVGTYRIDLRPRFVAGYMATEEWEVVYR